MAYETREQVLQAFKHDHAYYAEKCLKIVNKRAQLVPLVPRRGQLKFYAAIAKQKAAGLPVRIIVLKCRRTGLSTSSAGVVEQNTTQKANRRGLIVAHDVDTAAEIFDIANRMYTNLPPDPAVKPPLAGRRNAAKEKYLKFGNRAGVAHATGDAGLDSHIAIDTAGEVDAGRGKTITDLLCTEVASWKHPEKALSLMSAVADEPDTYIILESTAKGANFFKSRWDRAMRGEGGFAPVFIGWTEDEDCTRAFPSPGAREAFIKTIGSGPWGADEPRLVDVFGCTPEQLWWRRNAIVDKCDGKLEFFKQEFPSSPEEAFIGSGKHVFSIEFISKAIDRAEAIEKLPPARVGLGGPQRGVLLPSGVKTRALTYGTIEVPTGTIWTPQAATGFDATHPFWTVWSMPWRGADDVQKRFTAGLGGLTEADVAAARDLAAEPDGQYIVTVDPAGGDENTAGDQAFHAIEVIDHRTGEQVAEYASREDPDEIARQALLAGLWFNEAWISIEATGGWGLAPLRKLWKDFGYRRVFTRKSLDGTKEKTSDRLGWSTDRRTKPLMEDTAREELREGSHGIRSRALALEFTTYVKLPDGSHGPDAEAFSDRLMAWMQAKQLRGEIAVRPVPKPGGDEHSSLTRPLGG
ncbi:hypothetical protein DSM104299_03240 [Baekduia alba]|uniref:hypothetical protein n=1 Tax=Baekduia alba TaxID=2997333 RepID=UPI002342150F|nr:hypothetical protein [Baekduia alba]WCB94503.1 hypothetical protein DSM104299_03240 [Baekduia alba]